MPTLLIKNAHHSCNEAMVEEVFNIIFGKIINHIKCYTKHDTKTFFIYLTNTPNQILKDFIDYIHKHSFNRIEYQPTLFWDVTVYDEFVLSDFKPMFYGSKKTRIPYKLVNN